MAWHGYQYSTTLVQTTPATTGLIAIQFGTDISVPQTIYSNDLSDF